MHKIEKIYPRDIIGIISLIACFVLIGLGIDHVVSGIAIMIITYYFSKRLYEEKNGYEEKPVEEKLLAKGVKKILEAPELLTQTVPRPPIKYLPEITGDFKPLPQSYPL